MNFRMLSRFTGEILLIEIAAMAPGLEFLLPIKSITQSVGFDCDPSYGYGRRFTPTTETESETVLHCGRICCCRNFMVVDGVFGGLPFLFSGVITNPADCFLRQCPDLQQRERRSFQRLNPCREAFVLAQFYPLDWRDGHPCLSFGPPPEQHRGGLLYAFAPGGKPGAGRQGN